MYYVLYMSDTCKNNIFILFLAIETKCQRERKTKSTSADVSVTLMRPEADWHIMNWSPDRRISFSSEEEKKHLLDHSVLANTSITSWL